MTKVRLIPFCLAESCKNLFVSDPRPLYRQILMKKPQQMPGRGSGCQELGGILDAPVRFSRSASPGSRVP